MRLKLVVAGINPSDVRKREKQVREEEGEYL
jgi:hypothetical protein